MSYPGQQFEPPEKKAIVKNTGKICYILEYLEITNDDLDLYIVIFDGEHTVVTADKLNFKI